MTTESTEIAVIPRESALQVFQQDNGLDPYLQKIRDEIDQFTPDVSTRKGRDEIASIAHKVARSKTALDNVGKELVAELKELPKKIDAERKRMRDTLDAWKDEVRAPLTEWEQAEAARIAGHRGSIDQMKLRLECRDLDVAELKSNIAWLEVVEIGPHWEEFEAEAARAKDGALTALREALVIREKYEAEQAELAALRIKQAEQEQKDREDRIAREAAERAKAEAEAAVQAERDAAARREAEANAVAERAKREALEAQQRAEQAERDAQAKADQATADERRRQEAAAARAEADAKAREADVEHRKSINRAALAALIENGMTEEAGKQAITLIATGKVPAVRISY